MTLRQTIQAAPGKTAELIKKLSETSNQAIKTREGLFEQLGEELSRYVEIEEQHFLPLLRKHSETKELAVEALKGNKDLRASMKKLGAMPKDNDDFLSELDVLNKSFQQHIRNERKELLPAVLKAFSDEEAGALAQDIEAAVADAEKAKRDEKREENAKAKREAEKAQEAEASKQKAARAQKAAERTARETREKAADAAARTADKAKDDAREVRAKLKDQTKKAASDTQEAATITREATQKIGDDVQAVKASATVSAGVATEIYTAWNEWFGNAARINAEAAQQLMRCKTPQQIAEHQKEFATNALRNWMQGNAKLLEISQRSAKQAVNPLNRRLNDAG